MLDSHTDCSEPSLSVGICRNNMGTEMSGLSDTEAGGALSQGSHHLRLTAKVKRAYCLPGGMLRLITYDCIL